MKIKSKCILTFKRIFYSWVTFLVNIILSKKNMQKLQNISPKLTIKLKMLDNIIILGFLFNEIHKDHHLKFSFYSPTFLLSYPFIKS